MKIYFNPSIVKNKKLDQGFVVVNFLILLPMILGSFLFIYLLTSHIEIQSHLYDICRTELAETQTLVGQELGVLMALNPLVNTANWASMALKIASIFAYSNPVLFILLQKLIHGFEKLKSSIDKIQRALVAAMEQTMKLGIIKTRLQLTKEFYQYKWKLIDLTNLNSFSLKYSRLPMPAVEPTNKNKRPSTYKLKSDFIREQELFLDWALNSKIQTNFSQFAILNKTFKGKCIYSIQEGKPWSNVQIAVR